MTEPNRVEDTVYLDGDSMIYTISALNAQDTSTTQTVYVTYDTPASARLVPEVDVFSGQYVLHSDESDVLTSIFCGDTELGHREISIANTNSLLRESLGSVQTVCAFDEGNVNEKQPTESFSGAPMVSSGSPPANECYMTDREKADGDSVSDSVNLMSSSSENKASADSKGKSLIFSAIQATLSPDFLEAADDSLRDTLHKTTSEIGLEMAHSPETNLCYILGWNLNDFVKLEKVVACVLELAEAVSAKVFSKATNTDNIQRPETFDKGISCCLLQPQFSRAGREIRCKDYDLYEDVFDIAKIRSLPVSRRVTAKENLEIKGKKRRGRPPKALQKIDVNPVLMDAVTSTGNVGSHIEKEAAAIDNNFVMGTSVIPRNDFISLKTDEQCNQSLWLPVGQVAEDATVAKLETVTDEETATSDKSALIARLDKNAYESIVKTRTLKRSASLPSTDYESRAPFKHCPLCSFHTKRDSHLQKHVRLHDRNVPLLRCAQCAFSTTRQNHLTRHEMQHKSTVYHCDNVGCKYRTDNRRLLRRHATLRHCLTTNRVGERQSAMRPALECPMTNCTYKTHRAHLIRRHLARHTDVDGEGVLVDRYSCSACPYETKKREHYLRHINVVHSDVRPYLCDNCGRSFKRKDSLVQHSIVHLEKSNRVYQFECRTCHAKFRSQGHLQDHQAKHTSDRSYLCEICGSSFKTKAVQRKHILSIHSNPRSFTCTVCSKGFNTRYALKRHASSHSMKVGSTFGTETTLVVPQETMSLANASHAVAVITGLQSIETLQGGLVSIQPQLISVDQNIAQVPTQVVVRAPRIFAVNSKSDQGSQSHFLQQTF